MIILHLFDLFFTLLKSLSYNDFTMTFFYIIFLLLIIKALKGFLWSYS